MVTATSAALDGDKIVKNSDKMRFVEHDVSFMVQVSDMKGDKNQTTKYRVHAKGDAMSRVETVFPERQAGRRLLMKGDDLWLFTPDIKRPTRVSMQQRLTGEVANGDIARTNFASDYAATLVREEAVNGTPAYRLSLKKKRDGVTYPSIDYWVAKKGFVPLKAVFKTEGGKALKSALYKTPKTFFKRSLLTRMEITSALSDKQKSTLIFSDYKKEKLDESFFNKESLNN